MSDSLIDQAKLEIEQTLSRLSQKKQKIQSVYVRLAQKWGFRPKGVVFKVVGGREQRKPIAADSDVDIVFYPEDIRGMSIESIDAWENRNSFAEELNRTLWDLCGSRLHIVEHIGIAANAPKRI